MSLLLLRSSFLNM